MTEDTDYPAPWIAKAHDRIDHWMKPLADEVRYCEGDVFEIHPHRPCTFEQEIFDVLDGADFEFLRIRDGVLECAANKSTPSELPYED
ncbi:hypothetical protein [Halocatena halophila]|uniref:hypothetical protein n=1 Tax=Halocatena halophila TaxID=2814576 RepID=UPI002ED30D5B